MHVGELFDGQVLNVEYVYGPGVFKVTVGILIVNRTVYHFFFYDVEPSYWKGEAVWLLGDGLAEVVGVSMGIAVWPGYGVSNKHLPEVRSYLETKFRTFGFSFAHMVHKWSPGADYHYRYESLADYIVKPVKQTLCGRLFEWTKSP